MQTGIIDRVYGKYTKAPRPRLEAFKQTLKALDAANIAGDVVECGVWKGGHIIIARHVAPQRRCWLFDTFDGMTRPGKHDGEKAQAHWIGKHGRKWAAVSEAEVLHHLNYEHAYDPDLITFVAGDVRQTLHGDRLPDQIALLRLDTDFYDSTKIELEVLWPRIVRGGILIVDDYGHWPGCKKACQDYFGDKIKHFEPIDYTAVQMVKP